MNDKQWEVGSRVLVSYRSGEYIAEIIQLTPPKATLQTLAVVKHPLQGDLHHPYESNVPIFHQRKALSYRERFMVPLALLSPFHGEVPDYKESLQQALERDIETLERRSDKWAEQALHQLRELKKEYFS